MVKQFTRIFIGLAMLLFGAKIYNQEIPFNASETLNIRNEMNGLKVVAGSNKTYIFKDNGMLINIWISERYIEKENIPMCLSSNHISEVPSVSVIARDTLQPGWPVHVEYCANSSVAAADIDGDGDLEVIVGTYGPWGAYGEVYAWHHDATEVDGWPVRVIKSNPPCGVFCSPAIGDIDGDGDMEIVIGSWNDAGVGFHVHVLHPNGEYVTGWPKWTLDLLYSGIVLEDLNNDKVPEVIAATSDSVYAWFGDGDRVLGWPVAASGIIEASPAVGDIDNDGGNEVVVASRDISDSHIAWVYAWHYDGTVVSGWPKQVESFMMRSSPALADINGDSCLEVFIGTINPYGPDRVYAWYHNGHEVSGWPKETNNYVYSSPAIGDIDGDGDLEIIVGTTGGAVYAWHHNGDVVNGWPKMLNTDVFSSAALADIHGDSGIEVIIGSGPYDNKLYAFNNCGDTIPGWPKSLYQNSGMPSPAVADIDLDGHMEIAMSTWGNSVYVWKCSAVYDSKRVEWATFHHNNRRTGLYQSFEIDTLPPDIPTLISPSESSILSDNTPSFCWSRVTKKKSIPVTYTLQCARDTLFADLVIDTSRLTDTTHIPNALPDTTYYWRVEAVDEADNHSGYQIHPFNFTIDTKLPNISSTTIWTDTSFTGPFPVFSIITDLSGISSALLYYKTSVDNVWRADTMEIESPGVHAGEIPHQPENTTVYYYIYAEDEALPPNIAKDPDTAPDTLHSFIAGYNGISEAVMSVTKTFDLSQSCPNPFVSTTAISYQIPKDVHVSIRIYDVTGKLVKILINEKQNPGYYTAEWNGRNNKGKKVSSGMYFYRLEAENFKVTKKMVILR